LQLTRPAAVLSTLILAGCYGLAAPSAPERVGGGGGWGQGIDMPTDASNVLGELKGSGVDFVARYYRDPDSGWPPLSPREAQLLSAQGLKIVPVYEYHSPDPARFTYYGGYSDALIAYREAQAVGQPAESAIYFAADFHAQGDAVGSVIDYFRGVNAGLSAASSGAPYAVGVYGSGVVCAAVKGAGLARYTWLSNSIRWDDSTDYADWNIMQGAALQGLSFDNDGNQARNDYGGFQALGNSRAPSFDAGRLPPTAPQEQSSTSVSVIPSR
jgi:Rv2525c-like, glycoside hydrolase-like domain